MLQNIVLGPTGLTVKSIPVLNISFSSFSAAGSGALKENVFSPVLIFSVFIEMENLLDNFAYMRRLQN